MADNKPIGRLREEDGDQKRVTFGQQPEIRQIEIILGPSAMSDDTTTGTNYSASIGATSGTYYTTSVATDATDVTRYETPYYSTIGSATNMEASEENELGAPNPIHSQEEHIRDMWSHDSKSINSILSHEYKVDELPTEARRIHRKIIGLAQRIKNATNDTAINKAMLIRILKDIDLARKDLEDSEFQESLFLEFMDKLDHMESTSEKMMNKTEISRSQQIELGQGQPTSMEELTRALASQHMTSIPLPKFKSNSEDYLAWRQHITAIIFQSSFLPEARYGRILECVEGKALKMIQGLPFGAGAANHALRILDREYSKPHRVFEDQIKRLTKLPIFNQEKLDEAQDFVRTVESVANALHAAGFATEIDGELILRSVLAKLTFAVQGRWERNKSRFATGSKLERLAHFLFEELETRRSFVSMEKRQFIEKKEVKKEDKKEKRENIFTSTDNTKTSCPICKKSNHQLAECKKFTNLQPNQRISKAAEHRVCFKCLTAHARGSCNEPIGCTEDTECKYNHHKLLHGAKLKINKTDTVKKTDISKSDKEPEKDSSMVNTTVDQEADHVNTSFDEQRALRVVHVWIRSPGGNVAKKTVALMDNGCSRTTIDQELASSIGLKLKLQTRALHTLNCSDNKNRTAPVEFEITGNGKEWYSIANAGTRHKLRLAACKVPLEKWSKENPQIKKLGLEENIDYKDIRIIIGISDEHLIDPLPGSITRIGNIKAYETKLGWTISGDISTGESCNAIFSMTNYDEPTKDDKMQELTEEFKKFNSTETFGVACQNNSSKEEKETLKQLQNTIRLENNRVVIPMLWKDNIQVPESEIQSRNRLRSLISKLKRNPQLYQKYSENIINDEKSGYIQRLNPEEAEMLRKGKHWFLPHFPAFHQDKPDKPRRVLDAAAKNEGISLNQMLKTGPNNTSGLLAILIRFRCGKIAVNADINAMFPQIRVEPKDKNMLAFLWQEKEDGPLITYVSDRHIFGATCSPAIANFAIQEAGKNAKEPEITKVISKCFYVDDFYFSTDKEELAKDRCEKVTNTLEQHGFELRKFLSNSSKLISWLDPELRNPTVKEITEQNQLPQTKALGIAWSCKTDSIGFSTRRASLNAKTPADVLSTLASIFDPLGIVAPFTFVGKLILQKLWRHTGKWRAELSKGDQELWNQFVVDIPKIAQLQIPRWYGTFIEQPVELHIFTDASQNGFGCVAYFRFKAVTTFVAAKSRIAPTKPMTIPRLELQGFLMGTRLADTILQAIEDQLKITKVHFWTDSLVVFGWLHNQANKYAPFVANRLGEIHETFDEQRFQSRSPKIHYVPTKLNPADRLSRGQSGTNFVAEFKEWAINGPEILQRDPEQWPKNPAMKEEQTEIKPPVAEIHFATTDSGDNPDNYDQLNKFLEQHIGKENPSAQDFDEAEKEWVQKTQQENFQKEIEKTKKAGGRTIIHSGPLNRLQVIIDDDGNLREETRLTNTDILSFDQKYPIILPSKASFTRLVIRSCHEDVNHQGRKLTRAEIRRKYTISKFESTVRKELHKCPICRRHRPIAVQVPVAPLHSNRLEIDQRPFSSTGIDHFGPIKLAHNVKWYGLLFLCLTTRAIHLEACHSLDNPSFIMALERFISRRGVPKKIHCDQGSSFVGGDKELQKMEDKLPTEIARRWRSEFHFNLPGAPHWGGSWERMIKEIKKCLYASVSSPTALSAEAFQTSLVRIEAILNRRPLAFDDAGLALCPAMILNPASAETIGLPKDVSSLKILRQIQQVEQKFWKDWKTLYLYNLNAARVINRNRLIQLKVGDNVLIDDSKGNLMDVWTSGQITEVHPSADGCIRSATINTEDGKVTRSLNRLFINEGTALESPTWNPPKPLQQV